jgi:hypothetical protein
MSDLSFGAGLPLVGLDLQDADREYDPHEINAFTVTEFTTGYCLEFAVALQERIGGVVQAHTRPNDFLHAWVLRGDGRALDVRGVHPGEVALVWDAPVGAVVEDVRCEDHSLDAEIFAWAEALIERNRDRYGVLSGDAR